MSERALKQLVGALALAVVAWLVLSVARGGGSGSIAASGEITRVFDAVDGASVREMRVVDEGTEVTLARSGEGWSVNGFPADTGAVSRVLGALDEAGVGDLVAANPDNHDRMGVSSDSALHFTFRTDDQERTVLIGKAGRRFGTAYVRLPDQDEVYLLEGDLRSRIRRDLDGWRDRTMVAIDTAAVARIEVEHDGEAYALVRGDSVWTFEGGAEAVGTTVDGILSELARLVATGFLEAADSLAAQPEERRTTARSTAGEVLAEVTFGAGAGDRWARASTSEYLFRVSSFRADRVAPARDRVEPGS